ncbi:MAG: hypothetical protein II857_08515 [Selenomonadaceae bacterium]|nr:hypothetical protein [Selenomonadaceae bacterium]
MEFYTKPAIVSEYSADGLFPAVIVGPVTFGIKAILLAAGAAAALASKKGNSVIDSRHTSALTARKEFVFA